MLIRQLTDSMTKFVNSCTIFKRHPELVSGSKIKSVISNLSIKYSIFEVQIYYAKLD